MKKNAFVLLLVGLSVNPSWAVEKKPKTPQIPYRVTTQRIQAEITVDIDQAKKDLNMSCGSIANQAPRNAVSDTYSYDIDITSDDGNTLIALCEISGPSISIPSE